MNSPADFINLLLRSRNYLVQEITPEIAELSVNFGSELNNDPADRLIAATSMLANAPIVTTDENLRGDKLFKNNLVMPVSFSRMGFESNFIKTVASRVDIRF